MLLLYLEKLTYVFLSEKYTENTCQNKQFGNSCITYPGRF